ncbi:MAG: YidC/Oxa1 family insertase periplasmic-domain containing protein [Chitinispirillia bacterium]|nr:YidC/Oxa1 family insertase periplasmic-domain containing protein [Chitinispirillia bacterium]MCL2268508.1 YidC/Oxa1 family insertase periplasmic-domain containing protein [Chitinispirillia bacterium]
MNKNTLLAFALMVVVVIFFSSSMWNDFWYGTILKKPVPTYNQPQRPAPAPSESGQPQAGGEAKSAAPGGQALSAAGGDSLSAASGPDSIVDTSAQASRVVEDTVFVETNRIIAAVSTKGARIVSLIIKDYSYAAGPRKGELIDMVPQGSVGGAQLKINDESFDETFFNVVSDIGSNVAAVNTNGDVATDSVDGADNSGIADARSLSRKIVTVGDDGYELVLEAVSSDGQAIQKVFTFVDDTYRIGYTVRGKNIIGRKITTGWTGGIEEPNVGEDLPFGQMMDRRRAHYSDGKTALHLEMTKKGAEEPSGMFRWVGMSSKNFFIALVAQELSDADLRIEGRNVGRSQSAKEQVIDYSIYYQAQAAANEVNDWIYAGPNGIRELAQHKLKFEKSLFPVLSWARHIFWADSWFPPLAEIVLWTLLFFYSLVSDYGVAIFLLTLLCKLITFPMTQSSAKSMLRMKDLQPKLMKLREKYKSSPQKMNEEMMALYKSEGVNPFNPGCLPMFLQMPIFIALFIVLRKAIEMVGATSFLLPWVGDLSKPEALFYLPFSLPLYGNNVALMPIIMAALTFFQQKAVIQDPNQKAIVYIMPPIMLVMFNSFPAGVVFYWTMSSALSLAQQKWLPPKITRPDGTVATVGGGAAAAASTHSSGAATARRHKAPMKNKGGKRKK